MLSSKKVKLYVFIADLVATYKEQSHGNNYL